MRLEWNPDKEIWLNHHRQLSFELLVQAYYNDKIIDDIANKSAGRKEQRLMLFRHNRHICVVPYVLTEKVAFSKTMFLSRDYTKLYGEKL